jgi:hypothetical protein
MHLQAKVAVLRHSCAAVTLPAGFQGFRRW